MATNYQFLHVGFDAQVNKTDQIKALENTFDAAIDWLRYSANCWIVYTSQSPQTWTDRIRSTPGVEDAAFLIVPILITEKWGIEQQWIWDWMEKTR
jgi:hypothetical protein